MQTSQPLEVPFFSLLFAWAAHRIAARLSAMKPEFTAEEAAKAAVLGNNPPGA